MATPFEVQLLNLVYFGRPSDPAALQGWASTGLTSSEIVLQFVATDEYQINTLSPFVPGDGSIDLTGLINTYYLRLFDREAVASEIQGWTDAVASGAVNIDYLGITIANAGLNLPDGTDIRENLEKKLAAADIFSAQLAAVPADASLYNGFLPIAIGQEFLNQIDRNTTGIAGLAAASIDTLPPQGADFTLSTTSSTVQEGGSVIFKLQAYPINQPPAGKEYSYRINGFNGLQSSDLVGNSLTGTVTTDVNGVAFIEVAIKSDAIVEANEQFNVQINGFSTYTSTLVTVSDSVPTFVVNPSATAVNEGGTLSFLIETTLVASGTTLYYDLSGTGLTSADVNGAPLTGQVLVGNDGRAVVTFNVSNDLSTEGAETVTFKLATSVGGPVVAQTTSVINDTSVAPPVVTEAILTTSQDVSGLNIAAPTTGLFTYFANEQTLGQSDQLFRAPGATADVTLNVGTDGAFNLTNFSTDGIQTLSLRPSDEDPTDNGQVDLQAATGLRNINVEQSALGSVLFRDIQSAANFTTRLSDSVSDFEYNFDVNALTGFDVVSAIISETPIDAISGQGVGLDFTEGPTRGNAAIEALNLTSTGLNALNVVDILSVGAALETLTIDGDTSLDITSDLGLPSAGNSNLRISLINASGLNANLSLAYTSALSDGNADDNLFDVRVRGAVGENLLILDSVAPNPTDFQVVTQDSNDTVRTVGGADSINVAQGDNFVDAGDGQNTVTSGAGNDSIATGVGADLVTAGAGNNFVTTSGGSDTILTLGGNDSIAAGQGNDSVLAGDGDNTVIGDDSGNGAGNDAIVTGAGNDFINSDAIGKLLPDGQVGVQAFLPFTVSGEGNDSVISGAGNDTVLTGSGQNTVDSGLGDDIVVIGESADGKLLGDTFANTVTLGEGNDALLIDTNSLTVLESISGGIGIDTVQLHNGGTLSLSETLRTKQIEALDLVGTGDYSITLSDELVRSSDELSAAGSRVFSVFTTDDAAGNVQLDLSFLTPVDAQGNLLSIRYFGQAEQLPGDTDRELVIIRDGLINDQTVLAFGEDASDDDETFEDVLQIVDSADVTQDDLVNITGLEVIELASSVNGPQTFNIELTDPVEFLQLIGSDPDDDLIIRATPLLNGAVSTLFLNIGSQAIADRIIVEQSANLNVVFTGAFTAQVVTALFYTNSADRLPAGAVTPGNLPFIADGATVTAFQASDVQSFDFVNANEFELATETIEFRYAVSNPTATLEEQLNFTLINGIDLFRFIPAAVNQAVSFDGIGFGFAAGLDSIETSGGDDRLINIERNLAIITNAGNDTVSAGFDEGASTLFVDLGSGDDSFLGFGGSDTVIAGTGADTVEAGDGNNSVIGGFGDDSILTGAGNDVVIDIDFVLPSGTLVIAGNNTIVTGAGTDTVTTGSGNDSIQTGDGADTVGDAGGNNIIFTGLGADSVVTGNGNDLIDTADGIEVENDTVSSAGGNDTILVGLGSDTVDAGLGDDVIVLASDFDDPEFEVNSDAGGLSSGDSIIGGGGTDSLLFSVDVNTTIAPNLPGQFSLNSVENLVITALADDLDVTLARQVAIQAGGTINVVLTDADDAWGDALLDASAFTSGERLVAGLTDLEGTNTVLAGAGNDQLFTIGAPGSPTTLPFINSEVEGNYLYFGLGGADTVNLIDSDSQFEGVGYLTANDGGNAGDGDSASADLITGFRQTRDSVAPFTNIEDVVLIGGSLQDDVLFASGAASGSSLEFAFNTFVDFDGDAVLDVTRRSGLVIGNGVSDALLSDTAGIASRMNGFGLTSNTGQGGLVIVQGATESALYTFVEDGIQLDNVSSNELYKLGTFSGQVYLGGIDTAGNLITTVNSGYDSANFQFA